ncbi:MAG: ABC transporter ATP-binding protein [Anaerolineae bacterium]
MMGLKSRLILQAHGVDFSYYDGLVLEGVNLKLATGDLVALIGPNGSGKTTLLKLLNGLLAPQRGFVHLDGLDMHTMNRRQIARQIARVPQETKVPVAFTAWEMVMIGRTPYARILAGETAEDRRVVEETMELTHTTDLGDRPFNELSGGEQQRVVMAMALAQEPQILLLDEPTVHLDINHQVEILGLIQRLNRERGLTVLAAMHDLNLAALYFNRLVLLDGGRIVADGPPLDVLQERNVKQVFRASVRVQKHPLRDVPHLVVIPE